MHYAEGSLMPYLLMKLVFRRIKTAKLPFFAKPIARKIADKVSGDFIDPNLTRHLTFLGDHLEKHAWFAGTALTAADIQMSFPVEAAVARAGDMGLSPKLAAFVDNIRPNRVQALERRFYALYRSVLENRRSSQKSV
jgi:glutathione S-transferase